MHTHARMLAHSKMHTTIAGLTCNETIRASAADMGWPRDGCTGHAHPRARARVHACTHAHERVRREPLISADMAPMQWVQRTRYAKVRRLEPIV